MRKILNSITWAIKLSILVYIMTMIFMVGGEAFVNWEQISFPEGIWKWSRVVILVMIPGLSLIHYYNMSEESNINN